MRDRRSAELSHISAMSASPNLSSPGDNVFAIYHFPENTTRRPLIYKGEENILINVRRMDKYLEIFNYLKVKSILL